MASRKNVSAAVVRNFLNSEAGQAALVAAGAPTEVGTRGRHKPEQVAVFHKENPRQRYQTGAAEAPTITVPVVHLDKRGRRYTKEHTVTTKEARALLGHKTGAGKDSKRGRIPTDALAKALGCVGSKESDAPSK